LISLDEDGNWELLLLLLLLMLLLLMLAYCLQVDRRLNRYLKEMATVRKRERRMTLMSGKVKVKWHWPGRGQRL